jgi:hypothetical protein
VAETNLGKWNDWYASVSKQAGVRLYGDPTTYLIAAGFFVDTDEVEDWGCGLGGFRQFCLTQYRGIDGSMTPFADEIVDLCKYRSESPSILLRHVLEHNYEWRTILRSAVASFRHKLCVVLFTPFSATTTEINKTQMAGGNVPDISFQREDIEHEFDGLYWRLLPNIQTRSQYGYEQVYFVWRDRTIVGCDVG